MDNFTTAFLPIRKGSQRVKDKNFRAFGINGESLYELKIAQLLASEQIDRVIVSTTDERVYDYEFTNEKLTVIERPEELGLSTTKTDDLIKYALDLVDSGWLLWTHVTSPFFTAVDYDTFILDSKKKIASGDYDSAVTVLQHKGYFFTSQNLALFDQSRVRWPATQTVEPH